MIDSNGHIEKGRESYYVNKAIYLTKVNILDSAEYYFRKCANTTSELNNLKNCYIGLADLYKRRHNLDSIVKYSYLARITTDSMYAEMNIPHLQQMRAMYDYNEYKLSA